jgi:hypothetical protein
MTSEGSPYARFRRALETGNELLVLGAARELPQIALDDALRICLVLRDGDTTRYERAAVRWLGRYCVERPDVTLDDVEHARAAFALMRTDPEGALEILQAVCAPGAAAAARARVARRPAGSAVGH